MPYRLVRLRMPLVALLGLAVAVGCAPGRHTYRQKSKAPLGPPPVTALPPSPPSSVLVCSGGGMYGAFSAGFIAGWSQAGTRPDFDVVTGVSTGALVASAAFLGPDYDALAQRAYTRVKASDIYTGRAWLSVPFSESVASSAPLKKLIDGAVDERFVNAVACEHLRGRRLYVGTTNMETQRLSVWDMGAIASRGGPDALEKFRLVLLASCSVPGVFPPVRLRAEGGDGDELHADGGVTATLFVPPGVIAPPGGTDLYVLVSGKLFSDPAPVRPRVLNLLAATATSVIYASARAEAASLYNLCRANGANYHLVSLPADFPTTDAVGLGFDSKVMAQLYDCGYRLGAGGSGWQKTPPFESSATDRPRE